MFKINPSTGFNRGAAVQRGEALHSASDADEKCVSETDSESADHRKRRETAQIFHLAANRWLRTDEQ